MISNLSMLIDFLTNVLNPLTRISSSFLQSKQSLCRNEKKYNNPAKQIKRNKSLMIRWAVDRIYKAHYRSSHWKYYVTVQTYIVFQIKYNQCSKARCMFKSTYERKNSYSNRLWEFFQLLCHLRTSNCHIMLGCIHYQFRKRN